jgi:hypothetical protein
MVLYRALLLSPLCCALLATAVAAQSFSAFMGNPSGPATADSPYMPYPFYYQVALNPAHAVELGEGAPGLAGALMMIGIVDTNDRSFPNYPNGGTWTINNHQGVDNGIFLQGAYYLGTYAAWAEQYPQPTVTFPTGSYSIVSVDPAHATANAITLPTQSFPGYGGAAFGCHYERADGDPANDQLHWLQLVRMDAADLSTLWWVSIQSYDMGDGYYVFIDNLGAGTPFYDVAGAAANHTDFMDAPRHSYSSSLVWQFWTFIAWQPGGDGSKTLNLAAVAVHWGFNDPLHRGKHHEH